MDTLERLRHVWENGLTIIRYFQRDESEVLVVLSGFAGQYHCHRYFTVGTDWNVSVDVKSTDVADVFDWLVDCFTE